MMAAFPSNTVRLGPPTRMVVFVTLRNAEPPPQKPIVTAYAARRLPPGGIVWTRS